LDPTAKKTKTSIHVKRNGDDKQVKSLPTHDRSIIYHEKPETKTQLSWKVKNFSDHERPICSLIEYVTTRKYDKKEQSIRRAEPPKRKNRKKKK